MRLKTSVGQDSTLRSVFGLRLVLAVGLLAGAVIASAQPARADDMSFNAELLNSRLAGQASDGLHAYARRVETLAYDLDAAQRAKADSAAGREGDRVVWTMSLLRASGSLAEADELQELQEMLVVYRGLHGRVAATARAGDHAASVREAMRAAAVADEIHASLRRFEERNYAAFYVKATRFASAGGTAVSR
jgi:hypothetical protein